MGMPLMFNPRMSMKTRCVACRMTIDTCVCEDFPHFTLPTRVSVWIHAREYWKPSNTGHLARLGLSNSMVMIRRNPIDYEKEIPLVADGYTNIVLFPSENAKVLDQDFIASISGPINLVVTDGSWRQASKMVSRHPRLRSLPRVFLPVGAPSEYRLRVETRPEGMATFEAIARALGVLEGKRVQESLEQGFRLVTDRILRTRGRLPQENLSTVRNGYPSGKLRSGLSPVDIC